MARLGDQARNRQHPYLLAWQYSYPSPCAFTANVGTHSSPPKRSNCLSRQALKSLIGETYHLPTSSSYVSIRTGIVVIPVPYPLSPDSFVPRRWSGVDRRRQSVTLLITVVGCLLDSSLVCLTSRNNSRGTKFRETDPYLLMIRAIPSLDKTQSIHDYDHLVCKLVYKIRINSIAMIRRC